MIDKVLPGQRVTADTTNKMIDVCNGLQTPSESFVNTPNGTLTPVPGYQAKYAYMPVPETVLQAKRGPSLKMTSRGATRDVDQWSQDQKEMTWFCFLGPDTVALTDCLPSSKTPDSIWLGNTNTALFVEVTDTMLSSLQPTGYYADLAAYDEDAVAVKEVKLTKSDDDQDPGKNVLVICGASLDNFGKILEDQRYSEYDEADVVNTVLFAKINEQETVFQLPLKNEHSQQIDLVGDSQLSALGLSSCVVRELSGKPFIELHDFHVSDTVDVRVSDLSSVDIVMRNPNNGQPYLEYGRLCIDISPSLSAVVSGDTEVVGARKSIDLVDEQGSDPYYQLHDFQTSAESGPDTYLRFADQPTLTGADFSIGCQTQFVVRVPDGNNGYEIKYRQLSAFQQHERADGGTWNPRGRSIDFTQYDEGYGCYQVLQLYGFDWGCSNFITSADISGNSGNSILIRKWDGWGCCWQLDYMNFDSLDELAVKYVGDSQLSLSAHNPYSKSTAVWQDEYDGKRYVELYGFKNDFGCDHVTIHNDGCTYYWPQDIRTDQTLTENDYILVKHVDSNGNISLRYTQLEVQMPDLSSIEGDIDIIYSEIMSINSDIQYLSGSIDELSGHLSSEYWEQGGDSSTCYGSNIGDSDNNTVIDLDDQTLVGCWNCGAGLSVADSVLADNGFSTGASNYGPIGAYVDGAVRAGCSFEVGNSYLQESSLLVGCEITIGGTTLTESDLQALLQLIN